MASLRLEPRLLSAVVALHGWNQGGIFAVDRLLAREAPRCDALGRPDLHAVPTVLGCLAGVVRLACAGGHRDLRPGRLLVIAAGAWHEHIPLRAGCLACSLGIRQGQADLVIEDAAGATALALPLEPAASLLERLVASPGAEQRLALAQQLAGLLPGSTVIQIPDAVGRMADCLKRNQLRRLPVGEILDASGLCRRHARRLFIRHHGATPKQELTRRRLAIARQLISEGQSIIRAAAAAGFASRADLTRTWTRTYGGPPTRRRS